MKPVKFSVFILVLFVCVLGFSSCIQITYGVDDKFQGKWEVTSVSYQSDKHNLPYTYNETTITSAGYELGKDYVKIYLNGSLKNTYNDASSLADLFDKNIVDISYVTDHGSGGFISTIQSETLFTFYTDNNSILGKHSATYDIVGSQIEYVKKVTNFSWE